MAGIQLPLFALAWAALLSQVDLFATDAVLAAHDETCVECHNADQRRRCPKRLAMIAVMVREEAK